MNNCIYRLESPICIMCRRNLDSKGCYKWAQELVSYKEKNETDIEMCKEIARLKEERLKTKTYLQSALEATKRFIADLKAKVDDKTILRLYTGAPPAHETCPETGKLLCEIDIEGKPLYSGEVIHDGIMGWFRLSKGRRVIDGDVVKWKEPHRNSLVFAYTKVFKGATLHINEFHFDIDKAPEIMPDKKYDCICNLGYASGLFVGTFNFCPKCGQKMYIAEAERFKTEVFEKNMRDFSKKVEAFKTESDRLGREAFKAEYDKFTSQHWGKSIVEINKENSDLFVFKRRLTAEIYKGLKMDDLYKTDYIGSIKKITIGDTVGIHIGGDGCSTYRANLTVDTVISVMSKKEFYELYPTRFLSDIVDSCANKILHKLDQIMFDAYDKNKINLFACHVIDMPEEIYPGKLCDTEGIISFIYGIKQVDK